MKKAERDKHSILWWVWKKTFSFWQKLGFYIIPKHYGYPIPDTRSLKDDFWQKQSELTGIDMNEASQIGLLSSFLRLKPEYESLPREKTVVPHQYYINNGMFEAVDGEIAYCMIRHFKPRRFFETGSGNSTYLAAQAILKNRELDGMDCELTACDPYPNDILRSGFPGLSRLIQKKIQDVPLAEFSRLQENDILFIDSSHVLYTGSDVQYEMLEILPRLNKGVLVHIHDIFLPLEYPRQWPADEYMFFNEQYIVQAFLCFNDAFEVIWASNFMRLRHSEKLAEAFSTFRKDLNIWGSLWLRKLK